MAYSNVGIANLALGRIGVSKISVLTEKSDQSIAVNAVWEYIRDEVLEEIKPKFATIRVALAQSITTPIYGWKYAYAIPADFLCLAENYDYDPVVYVGSDPFYLPYFQPAIGNMLKYSIEELSDGNKYLLTNWDSVSTTENIYLRYIRKVTDVTKYTPSFINVFAFRGAAELSFTIAESGSKFQAMMTLYDKFRLDAISKNRALDYNDDMGNENWVDARIGAGINPIILR